TPAAVLPAGTSIITRSVRPWYLIPAAVALRRTPASGGNSGKGTASGETAFVMSFLPLIRLAREALLRRRYRMIGGLGRGSVEVEPFHRHVGARLIEHLADFLVDHLLPQLISRLVERRRRRGAVIQSLDHMPAELRVYRRGADLLVLQRERGGGEFRYHVGGLEIAEVAALLHGGRILAVLFRQRREIAAFLQLGDDLLRDRLIIHQDMAGVHFLGRRLGADFLVEARLHGGVGDFGPDLLLQEGGHQSAFLYLTQRALDRAILVDTLLAGLLRQHLGIHHLIQHSGQQLFGRHLAGLRRQAVGGVGDVAQVDEVGADLRHHRVGLVVSPDGGRERTADEARGQQDNGEKAGGVPAGGCRVTCHRDLGWTNEGGLMEECPRAHKVRGQDRPIRGANFTGR